MAQQRTLDSRRIGLEPGTLRPRLIAQIVHAQRTGALISIPTNATLLTDHGVPFIVRIVTNLVRKEATQRLTTQASGAGSKVNPFLPYDPDLFVADLSPTHLCLLNKFNVVNEHLLLVTRRFEAQTSWLTLADFDAMWRCLHECDGLVFYNGGPTAGASQPHKHLQFLPFSADTATTIAPFLALLPSVTFEQGVGMVPHFPFVHGLVCGDATLLELPPVEAALWTLQQYQQLCTHLAIQPDAYNLLATRRWLLVVPRTQEHSNGISINALGFAGSLLVRNQAELDYVRQVGPLTMLTQVARRYKQVIR